MTIPTTDRMQRTSGVDANRRGEREVSRERTPTNPASDIITELRSIHQLLERQQKPFTLQKFGVNSNRYNAANNTLPAAPTQNGVMVLDHDDDRDLIILLNVGAGSNVLFKWDDGNFSDLINGLAGFLIPNVPIIFGPGGAPSNRLFMASAGGSHDVLVTVIKIDRFPISTR